MNAWNDALQWIRENPWLARLALFLSLAGTILVIDSFAATSCDSRPITAPDTDVLGKRRPGAQLMHLRLELRSGDNGCARRPRRGGLSELGQIIPCSGGRSRTSVDALARPENVCACFSM
jgi:hypothetical protein